jgi:hypothetical protein
MFENVAKAFLFIILQNPSAKAGGNKNCKKWSDDVNCRSLHRLCENEASSD